MSRLGQVFTTFTVMVFLPGSSGARPGDPVRSLPQEADMLSVHKDVRHLAYGAEIDDEAVRLLLFPDGKGIRIGSDT